MADGYRIWGAEVSPYSVKVRSYFRYKELAHEWIVRGPDNMEEYKQYSKLPLIPTVVTPDDEGIQDSTPIIEKIEARHPEPSIHPSDPVASFVSALIEEFGDEWGNKWMFHYRWAREADQQSAGKRLAAAMAPGVEGDALQGIVDGIVDRMVNRVWFVGSSEQTAPAIEQSFKDGITRLDAHLATRPFLFGERPAFGDFGLWGQVYNAWTDPTCNEIIEASAPNVVAWIQRMLEPEGTGDFENWADLSPTLEPLLEEQVAALFLPWSDANSRAIAAGSEEFSIELPSGTWTQKPQKYHARSLGKLRNRYQALENTSLLDPVLERTNCLGWLSGS
ncbi:glutathione S-transferase family protein [Myxococcota bacterium]|nr:glutathione S-transferase family protein [Myxococcota bacterium]